MWYRYPPDIDDDDEASDDDLGGPQENSQEEDDYLDELWDSVVPAPNGFGYIYRGIWYRYPPTPATTKPTKLQSP